MAILGLQEILFQIQRGLPLVLRHKMCVPYRHGKRLVTEELFDCQNRFPLQCEP